MADAVRVSVGFSGGQVVEVKITEATLKKLRQSLDKADGWTDLETDDGIISIDLNQVVFLRGAATAQSIGFGGVAGMRVKALLLGAAALAGAALYWRRNPSACPYGQRWMVEIPHPFVTRERLKEILAVSQGERILEVGPGTGYYTLDVAEWLGERGSVDILDIQQEMLDHTMTAAGERGITNITATQSDATRMPYDDAGFDGAFLVTVLGEIPDQDAALRELARVVKPGGRVVIGELMGDPHYVTLSSMRLRAAGAGLEFERRVGNALGFFARFRRPLAASAVQSISSGPRTAAARCARLAPLRGSACSGSLASRAALARAVQPSAASPASADSS